VVLTPAGRIEAGTVVLALGAWSGAIGELRRATVPIGSHIVATEPLGERVSQLGWARGELFGDSRLMVHYAQVTRDGRIVFGRGGGAIGAAGRVLPAHFHDPATVASIARDFGRWFPSLRGVRFTHAWGGPVDRAPEHMPFTGRLSGDGDVLYGLGFSGNGVAPSALIGRILGRQALGVEDPDTRSPLTAGPPSYLPPEPLRSAGGAVVRKTVELAEKAEEHGVRVLPRALLDRLTSVSVPRALEPRRRR
jgi:glycine/D-amino acid oxidase-like deaminating enzyme